MRALFASMVIALLHCPFGDQRFLMKSLGYPNNTSVIRPWESVFYLVLHDINISLQKNFYKNSIWMILLLDLHQNFCLLKEIFAWKTHSSDGKITWVRQGWHKISEHWQFYSPKCNLSTVVVSRSRSCYDFKKNKLGTVHEHAFSSLCIERFCSFGTKSSTLKWTC